MASLFVLLQRYVVFLTFPTIVVGVQRIFQGKGLRAVRISAVRAVAPVSGPAVTLSWSDSLWRAPVPTRGEPVKRCCAPTMPYNRSYSHSFGMVTTQPVAEDSRTASKTCMQR